MFWQEPGLILGRSGPWFPFPAARVPQFARSGHVYVVGKTGKGKSKLLQSCIVQDIAAGRGCGVIDPHADLITDVLSLLYERGMLKDSNLLGRIVYVNPAEHDYVVPFNVLAAPGAPYEVAQNVIEAFRRTWTESLSNAPHFANVMLHALLLLIATKLTLIDLPRLLTDEAFRERLLRQAGDPDLTAYFHDRYDAWGREGPVMRESSLNKVTALSMNPHLRLMLGQRENRLDLRTFMDEGKVLLVDLGHCDEESQKLIGNLIATGLEQAAFSRHILPPQQRRPFYLYVDEFWDFAATAGSVKTMSKVLSGARKFGLHLTLAHQNLSQLTERMKGAVMGNVWTKVIFGVSEDDALEFARMIGLGNVDPQLVKHEAPTDTQHPLYAPLLEQWHEWATHLANQKPRQAVVKDHEGKTKHIWTVALKPTADLKPLARVRRVLMMRSGIPLAQARAEQKRARTRLEPPARPFVERRNTP